MTDQQRMATLRALDAILQENVGNRNTPALINGIVNTLHGFMEQFIEQPKPPLSSEPAKGNEA